MIKGWACALGLFAWVAWSGTASADEELTTPRSIGMADALRGAAVGAAGLHVNPSGIALTHSYSVEAGYFARGDDSLNHIDLSIVDAFGSNEAIAAGAYFRYMDAKANRSGSEAGLALAIPIGSMFTFGILPKYESIGAPAPGAGVAKGFTMDVGTTFRPFEMLSFGVVGGNLIEMDSLEAPRTFSWGIALCLSTFLQAGYDMVTDFDTSRMIGKGDQSSQRHHVGAEVSFHPSFALRTGYLHDGAFDASGITFGGSVLSSTVALDFGGRKMIDGATLFGLALRLFLPVPGSGPGPGSQGNW